MGGARKDSVRVELIERLAELLSQPSETLWLEALRLTAAEVSAAGGLVAVYRGEGEPRVVISHGEVCRTPVASEILMFFGGILRCEGTLNECSELVLETSPRFACCGLRYAQDEVLCLVLWGSAAAEFGETWLLRLFLRLLNPTLHGVFRAAPRGDFPAAFARPPAPQFPPGYVVGHSEAAARLHREIELFSASDLPVLIVGETGVGKEYVARTLHEWSPRRSGPFVAVNCAALPTELLEAEMFGIGRGVATGVQEREGYFRAAHTGSLFLDEVSEIPLALQAKLLRALQEKEFHSVGGGFVSVNARIICATNSELTRRVEEGRFRADLYYRIAGLTLRVPPLRERKEDLSMLMHHLLMRSLREAGKAVRGITLDALGMLNSYDWPGNIRELEHELRRLAILCPDGEVIDASLLSDAVVNFAPGPALKRSPSESLDLNSRIEELQRTIIRRALLRARGNQTQAARLLGITRNGLALKVKRLGLSDLAPDQFTP